MPIHKPLLHELLDEDQEPFQLKNYIAHRSSQLNKSLRPEFQPFLQIKCNPISSKSKRRSLCKHGCFQPFQDSQVVVKSETSDFIESQSKFTTTTRPGSVYLHIPAQTSASLLEAAKRIQNQQGKSKPRASIGVGLFSAVLKKLMKDTNRTRNHEYEIRSVEDNKSRQSEIKVEINSNHSNGRRSSDEEVRFSSGRLSENNEEGRRCLDIETSTSSWRSENSGEIDFVAPDNENWGFSPSRKRFWSSPSRFSSQKSFSSGRGSPSISSPASSPGQRKAQEKHQMNCCKNIKKEGKEEGSPISVLDPPFENDDVIEDHKKYNDDEYSFAFVERAKEQLLNKLRRFELLANLDPVELQKRMIEQLNEHEEHHDDDHENGSLDEEDAHVLENKSKVLFEEIKNKTKWLNKGNIVFGKVFTKKMDFCEEEISKSIDIMVQSDLDNEWNFWKRFQTQNEEIAMQIELSIFGHLLEEFIESLIESSYHEIVFLPSN